MKIDSTYDRLIDDDIYSLRYRAVYEENNGTATRQISVDSFKKFINKLYKLIAGSRRAKFNFQTHFHGKYQLEGEPSSVFF